jgi:hypothetical protein
MHEHGPACARDCPTCNNRTIQPSTVWMQLYSGKPFYPWNPDEDSINILDIAHALSMVCRYNGHCVRFYSVAEHSVLLSYAVDPEHALWALLHDAAEAYIGDMVRPLKPHIEDFKSIERSLEQTIARKFNLPGDMPNQVREYDTRIVQDERAQIMAPSHLPWTAIAEYAPLGVTINGWLPTVAEMAFLNRYYTLTDNNGVNA